ncbi:MAG: GtrA family protein [Williamsia sp.]|nr:GtrA family protein [Williamsia sp.]
MFVKAQFASLFASVIDFLTTIMLVSVFKMLYLPACMVGIVAGGICHFTISRHWVFYATEKDRVAQIIKYVLVWSGNFGLNAAGLYLALHFLGVNYVLAKGVVAILVGIGYNYALQKRFVFK